MDELNNQLSGTFGAWNLSAPIMKALAAMQFNTPTPIQTQAIPLVLTGKDIIGCAQTGTGKTGAFCIPMLSILSADPLKTALILTPTRELATQIEDVLKKLTAYLPEARTALLIGGAAMGPQMKALQRKPRIVIATPGRLMDHLRRRSVNLRHVAMLVLDEADRMLDMGFAPQLEEIKDWLPEERQTLLFSATIPGNIKRLAANYLTNPEHISVGQVSMPAPKIKHSILETTHAAKNNLLVDELNKREGSILIFAKTKHGTDRLANYLIDYGFSVTMIHGDRSQNQRDNAVAGFRKGSFKIMVATDVVSRGLDIPHIAHVINYDLPMCPEDYVHRIGRTARAGAEGNAVCLLTPADRGLWRRIARMYNYEVGTGGAKAHPRIESRAPRTSEGSGLPRFQTGPARREFRQEREDFGRPPRRDDNFRSQERPHGRFTKRPEDRPVRFRRPEDGNVAPQNRPVLGGFSEDREQRPRGRFEPRGLGGPRSDSRSENRDRSGGKPRGAFGANRFGSRSEKSDKPERSERRQY